MNSFYTALPYVLIFFQGVGVASIVRHQVIAGTAKSKWALAFWAALPIPALLTALVVFGFMDVIVGGPTRCSAGGCASDREAFITLILAALAFYVFGFFIALLGYRMGKAVLQRRKSQ